MSEIKNNILNIAMNLTRIGNWAADDFDGKKKRIQQFLDQTEVYNNNLSSSNIPNKLQITLKEFNSQFNKLKILDKIDNKLIWAEKMMTWGTILTHRSSLISS